MNQMRLWAHSRGRGAQREAASPRPRRAEQEADKHDEGGNDQLSLYFHPHCLLCSFKSFCKYFSEQCGVNLKKNLELINIPCQTQT